VTISSSSFITWAGEKKCRPMTRDGVRGAGGDLVDVEIGGVGGEDGVGPGDGVELGEDGLLHVHVLEHRLDDEVGMGKRAEIRGDLQRGFGIGARLGAQKPAFGAVVEDGEDAGPGDPGALVVAFDHGHVRRQKAGGGDARAHGAAAEDADLRPAGGARRPFVSGMRETARSAKKMWRRAADWSLSRSG
jgi:hypothetical protein